MHGRFSHLGRLTALLALGCGTVLVAQTGSGTLSVVAKDTSGKPMAGVRIILRSEKLQGERTGITDAQGIFRAALLPPGSYTGIVSLDGYKTGSLSAVVPLGGATTVDAILRKAETAEAVVTVIGSQGKVEKTEVSVTENYTQEDILKLPVGRTLAGITQLAPGVTTGASTRIVIGGSASYENKFLVNGADVNDNYFGTDVGLFIEDAIDETQVLTNSVSAEYGRFTGGVINALTKRGGNTFEGSLRVTATNQNWNAVLPSIDRNPTLGITGADVRASIVDKINKTYVATVGGPIVKDKLWFFFAGRSTKTENSLSLPGSGVQYVNAVDETRYEANVTWQVTPNHRLLASYLSREVKSNHRAPLVNNTADPAGLSNRKDPLSLKTLQYDGILSANVNLNVQFTEKKQKITSSSIGFPGNNGGTAFWQSPVFDPTGLLFNNHYFGNDPEERNNQSIKAVLTLYLTGAGQHQVKLGYEQFKEINIGTNQQSPTGFNIDATGVDYTDINAVKYDFDADSYLEDWTLAPGGKFTSTYNSFFVNDNWTLNTHFNFSLGARLEKVPEGFRVAHIYRADPDEPGSLSPLAKPGVDVHEGDVITAINGTPLASVADVGEVLRNQAGKQVLLEVASPSPSASPSPKSVRRVVVVPMTPQEESTLRYTEWEYTRRLAVDSASQGRIGYLHLRAMGPNDMAQFQRDFYPLHDRDALVVDMRNNNGGNIDSWVLEKLLRKPWMWWQDRQGDPSPNMQWAFRGPMVVLVNERTASDGEAFAEGFRRLGLGKVIGTRTWGGEIWLSSSNVLVDRGIATAAESGVFAPDAGWLIEGHGVDPDVVVDNPPATTFGGRDLQLEAALSYLRAELQKNPPAKVKAPGRPRVKP